MHFKYKTRGTCAGAIEIDVEDDILKNVVFIGGCRGNTQGVAKLAQNRNIDEVISLLNGIQCRGGTSCPDQLSKALEYYKENLR